MHVTSFFRRAIFCMILGQRVLRECIALRFGIKNTSRAFKTVFMQKMDHLDAESLLKWPDIKTSPDLIVFDLDMCLWTPETYELGI